MKEKIKLGILVAGVSVWTGSAALAGGNHSFPEAPEEAIAVGMINARMWEIGMGRPTSEEDSLTVRSQLGHAKIVIARGNKRLTQLTAESIESNFLTRLKESLKVAENCLNLMTQFDSKLHVTYSPELLALDEKLTIELSKVLKLLRLIEDRHVE